tara:strand:+ start:1056 stop:1349 length:294 start_codon:yes stop_codon:yes gene_type:complete
MGRFFDSIERIEPYSKTVYKKEIAPNYSCQMMLVSLTSKTLAILSLCLNWKVLSPLSIIVRSAGLMPINALSLLCEILFTDNNSLNLTLVCVVSINV